MSEPARSQYEHLADEDGQTVAHYVDAAVALIERVSVAGDAAEIARRRELAAELGNELDELKAEIEKRLSPAWRSAQKAGDKAAEKEVRAQARAELERGTARLQERFWAEAARG